jgi:hypothetical protein
MEADTPQRREGGAVGRGVGAHSPVARLTSL